MNDKTNNSVSPEEIIRHLVQEGMAAISHYQVWSVFGEREHLTRQEIFNHVDYGDFFHASYTAHYKMIFIALGKIFDKGTKTASIKTLIKVLERENRNDLVTYIEEKLGPQTDIHKRADRIQKIEAIRNQSIAHNRRNVSKKEIYERTCLTPDDICHLINDTCNVINHLASEFGCNGLSTSGRAKKSMLKALDVLMAA